MSSDIHLPPDCFAGSGPPDLDLAADYLELKAVCAKDGRSYSQDIVNTLELAAEQDFLDVDTEMKRRESVADDAVARMQSRKNALMMAYPFELDSRGETISFTAERPTLGEAAYLVSLLLSNLRSVSQLLDAFDGHPSKAEERTLRQFFQYIATAAIAAEIGGRAWSFGFPRPDGSGFLTKLKEIWAVLKDGTVGPDDSAPRYIKDDQVDVFACREPNDGLPGFLLVAAQVATGSDWDMKSIRHHVAEVFRARWFTRIPVTQMLPYLVIPFARPEREFRDDVLKMGYLLHRLRVPRRVHEAQKLDANGVKIEAFDQLAKIAEWTRIYVERVRQT